jgi:NAD(P)-dependent dehydrogenase (short-subunit alcohol dehydrogenase family)
MSNHRPVALIIGASRGLGWGLAREYLRRRWDVVATVRDVHQHTPLHDLCESEGDAGGELHIEQIDITVPNQIDALHARLADRTFDLLFVNAGVANDPTQPVGEVSTDEFVRVMVTNTLSPMRVVERLIDRVSPQGKVAVMSSELGSVTNNDTGGWEVYRGSKAALNTLMRSFVSRRADDQRTFYTVAPGWVRTDLGSDSAPLDIDTSIPGVADALESRAGTRGVVFVNYRNEILPW